MDARNRLFLKCVVSYSNTPHTHTHKHTNAPMRTHAPKVGVIKCLCCAEQLFMVFDSITYIQAYLIPSITHIVEDLTTHIHKLTYIKQIPTHTQQTHTLNNHTNVKQDMDISLLVNTFNIRFSLIQSVTRMAIASACIKFGAPLTLTARTYVCTYVYVYLCIYVLIILTRFISLQCMHAFSYIHTLIHTYRYKAHTNTYTYTCKAFRDASFWLYCWCVGVLQPTYIRTHAH